MKLVEPYFETGRDVCTDNFFTTYNLAKLLLEKKLTLLGTVRRQRRDAPRSMVNKMELYNSKFVYCITTKMEYALLQTRQRKTNFRLLC